MIGTILQFSTISDEHYKTYLNRMMTRVIGKELKWVSSSLE